MNDMSSLHWRKSTRSGAEGGQCVEVADLSAIVAAQDSWRKSTRSGAEGGECVEVADLRAAIAVRDSKNPQGPTLSFSRPAFRTLAHDIRTGRFDL